MAYRKLEGRDATIKNYAIKATYPLILWADCCKCSGEFRREYGWKFSYSLNHRMNATRYICISCAPTIGCAADIVKLYLKKPERPPPPPAPPRKRMPVPSRAITTGPR